jgi:hypothetical protein
MVEGDVLRPRDQAGAVLDRFPVDLSRFDASRRLPEHPRRALILSNTTRAGRWVAAVRTACRDQAIEVAVVGVEKGNAVGDTAELLSQYDVVFARAVPPSKPRRVGPSW